MCRVSMHKRPVVQLKLISLIIYHQKMVQGNLHMVILTLFVGKLLVEQQPLVYGCVPPLIVDICLNVQSSIPERYWGPFSFHTGELFTFITSCIGGLGDQ